MLIAITTGDITSFPERCLLSSLTPQKHRICEHPLVTPDQTLFCPYYNTPTAFTEIPARCPLRRQAVEGIKIEAM